MVFAIQSFQPANADARGAPEEVADDLNDPCKLILAVCAHVELVGGFQKGQSA